MSKGSRIVSWTGYHPRVNYEQLRLLPVSVNTDSLLGGCDLTKGRPRSSRTETVSLVSVHGKGDGEGESSSKFVFTGREPSNSLPEDPDLVDVSILTFCRLSRRRSPYHVCSSPILTKRHDLKELSRKIGPIVLLVVDYVND